MRKHIKPNSLDRSGAGYGPESSWSSCFLLAPFLINLDSAKQRVFTDISDNRSRLEARRNRSPFFSAPFHNIFWEEVMRFRKRSREIRFLFGLSGGQHASPGKGSNCPTYL